MRFLERIWALALGTAPADGDLRNSEISPWQDEGLDQLKFKGKKSNGTVVTYVVGTSVGGGGGGVYTTLIGDGVATSFTINQATHGLAANGAILVQVNKVSDGNVERPSISVSDTTGAVTIGFVSAPATNSYRVTLLGSASGQAWGEINASKRVTTGLVLAGDINGTYNTDASLGNEFRIRLTGDLTLANPTNPADGQLIRWRLKQDNIGSRTLALGAKFRLGTDIPSVTLTTTADKADYLTAVYCLADDKWDVVAFVKGY
jgi:hypothetical protein